MAGIMPGAIRRALVSSVTLLLLWLRPFPAQASGEKETRNVVHFQVHHEITVPQWRADGSAGNDKHPPRAEVNITAEGRNLILDIEKNEQLFAPSYTETHYTKSGTPYTITLNHTNHCFYHGVVRGMEDSSVALSTCSGLRGLIVLNSNLSYVLEPLPHNQEQHLIYRTEHFKFPRGTCGSKQSGSEAIEWLTELTDQAEPSYHRVKRDDEQSTKFVELLLVADYAEFQKNNHDLQATKNKLVEAANYVDKFYKSLNIRIALVGLEVWNDHNKCEISSNPHSTLWSFLAWRRKQLSYKKHDNAQLITGMAFHGTTIGLAPLMTMCSVYQSGGVNMDHSDNAIGVAATMAHEMGHNFGMSHDSTGCCTASAKDGGCIMAAATGHPFPKVFNWCNKKELNRYMQSGGGMCLYNMPDTKTLYGGQRCGNGYLEEGEECDCGEAEECKNPCCNAANCSLKPGAECAHGTCCHQCKLISPGTLCRQQSRPCDLPEYCTGKSPFCPANFYQLDGTPCAGGRAYCYSGMCLTYEQQCLQLWGNGAQSAPDLCFERVNAAGDTYGNCGKDVNGRYKKCDTRDAKCGKIQCQSSASKPLESNAVAIDTTITLNGRQIRCRGTHVYRNEEEGGDILDPGLVMAGTKCGDSHICFEGHCRNTSFLDTGDCGKKCNGQGVCNNNQNCHCFSGWAPPFCNKPGNGGSLDSGPMLQESPVPIIAGVLISLLLLTAIGIAFCCYKWRARLGPLKSSIIPPKNMPQFSTAPIQNGVNGHANPAFKLKTPQEHRKVIGSHNVPANPEVLYCQTAPELKLHVQVSPAVPDNNTRRPPILGHQNEVKKLAKRIPPSRPAPPAPKVVIPQDSSRLQPPQKALPANPVSSSNRPVLPKMNASGVQPHVVARNPGIHQNSVIKNSGPVGAWKKKACWSCANLKMPSPDSYDYGENSRLGFGKVISYPWYT
ncbi:disintegrin and metalloproteinase domain-containing protein 19 isoform X2 [Sphaerodactylus townsendi]|uniref:disintegrin and metalloproteinase domain-containing protein 19 isoform X2 n=1 Tax=Sphaerodactylus townsendi TaxID=933632 RepID=UPI0020263643|nr:disintegrin and metalloproteinase domain-containing protein 19 isoform X2 [Sphaerodactylus townsendi]